MKQRISSVLALLMILILVISSGLLISYGAHLVQTIQAQSESELNDRSLRLYFNNRFKQNDSLNKISVIDNTLIFNEEGYYILIYVEEDALVEQVSNDLEKINNSGERLAQVKDLKFELNNHSIRINYSNMDNETISLLYSLKAGQSNE